jgi:hypothetical protein
MVVATRAASGAKAALGVEQEHARRDDLLAPFETLSNFDTVGQLNAHDYSAWLEAIACGDKHVLLQAGVDHRIAWDGDDVLARRCESSRPIQTWPECASGIRR